MRTAKLQQEALHRARDGFTMSNYPAIIKGFVDRGIPVDDIRPRENVFTYNAWKALGRQVRRRPADIPKGQYGVTVTTWVPIGPKTDTDTGETIRKAGCRPKTATVFHISQTDPIEKD